MQLLSLNLGLLIMGGTFFIKGVRDFIVGKGFAAYLYAPIAT